MDKDQSTTIWDAIVIGGGPAGMMAAGRAAELGKSVLLLEKNEILGKKLLITGGGRCNLTNFKPDMKVLVPSYKNTPRQLYSLFSQFGVDKTIGFFNSRGLETKVEAEDRVFPITDKAESVWQVMIDYIEEHNVTIQNNASVRSIDYDPKTKLFKVSTNDSIETSKACVVATGGSSHPETGSTGDGFEWLKNLGHTIIDNNFALVPVSIKDNWVKKLSGVTLRDVGISIWFESKKQKSSVGKILFTHFGVSGPTVLNMSSTIGDLLQYGDVTLKIDLLPDIIDEELKTKIHELLTTDSNKMIKNTLKTLVPSALVSPLLELADISGDTPCHSVNKEQRVSLRLLIKNLPMTVHELLGADKAVVSSGGVLINEVNFKTMESNIVQGLYIIGDVLNIDRPSGGYSLQLCWASGFVAGSSMN